jgi:hypothetical protein
VPERIGQGDANTQDDFALMTDLWNFFHYGFNLREIWFDSAHPVMFDLMLRIGMKVRHERTRRVQPWPNARKGSRTPGPAA